MISLQFYCNFPECFIKIFSQKNFTNLVNSNDAYPYFCFTYLGKFIPHTLECCISFVHGVHEVFLKIKFDVKTWLLQMLNVFSSQVTVIIVVTSFSRCNEKSSFSCPIYILTSPQITKQQYLVYSPCSHNKRATMFKCPQSYQLCLSQFIRPSNCFIFCHKYLVYGVHGQLRLKVKHYHCLARQI